MIEVYKIVKEIYDSKTTCNILKYRDKIHLLLRGHNYILEHKRLYNPMRVNFFANRVVNNWNSLPEYIVEAGSLNIFKNSLDRLWSNQDLLYNYIVYRPGYFTVHPPPALSRPKFSNSENCCGSENAMPPKIFWDMEGHRGHFRSKNVFFFKKHILEKIHNKSHYFFKF